MNSQRLAKVLAQAGVASRRKCEEIIFKGLVKVNGSTTFMPQTKVDPKQDIILVKEKPISLEKKLYFIFNKPKGFICSNLPNRRTIYRFFDKVKERIFSIGRLDKDTEGLLILTNDGEFANQVIHPSSNISKEYIVKTNKEITAAHLKTIAEGTIVENTFVKPKKVQKVRKGTLKIIVTDGKKHEVRHLVAQADLTVLHLKRTRIGGLHLNELPLGTYRPLTEKEKLLVFQSSCV